MDIASLGISVDSREVKTAKEWIDDLSRSGDRAEKSMGRVGAGGRTASAGTRQAADASRTAARAMDAQATAAQRLTAMIRTYASAMVGAFGVREVIQAADAWQGLENRLRLVTRSQSSLKTAMNDVYNIAQRTSQGIDSVGQVYQRFAMNANALGLSQQKIAELSETTAKAIAVSGSEAGAAEGALMQFGQALAAGVLRGEEFNSVMEGAPGLAQALAAGLNVPVGSLRGLAAQGKITGDVIVQALTKARDSVDSQFDTRIKTVSQSMTELGNAVTRYIGEMSGATNASQGLAGGISSLAQAIDRARDSMDGVQRELDAFKTFGEVVVEAWDAVDQFGQNFQRMLGTSEDRVASLGDGMAKTFEESFLSTAKEVDALYDVFMGSIAGIQAGFRTLGENIAATFEWGFNKALASFSTLTVAVSDWLNSTFNTNRFNFKLADDPGALHLKSLRDEIAKAHTEAEGMLGAHDALLERLNGMAESRAWLTLYSGMEEGANAATQATNQLTPALGAAQKAAAAFAKQRESDLNAIYRNISAIHEESQSIEDQVALFGLSKTALEDLAIARLDEQRVMLDGLYGDKANVAVKAIEREIEARQRLRTAMGSLEAKEAEQAAWDEWARDVEQIFDQVGQSLTDAIFDGGKSGRELVRDLFKTLTLRVLVQPVMGALQGQMTQQLGGMFGYQNPQQGNILSYGQSLNSAYQAANGGLSSTFGNAAQWLGRQVGSEALSAFGMGMSGAGGIAAIGTGLGASLGTTIGTSAAAMTTTTFSAALGGGAGAAAGSGIIGGVAGGGAAGLGAALGAALPWVGGALAIGSAFGLFDDGPPKTRHGQRARVDFSDGAYGVTSTDDRQPGAENAIRQMAQQAVDTANALMRQTGVDAAIEAFYAITESSVLGDRQGVASGGTLRIGDQMRQIGIAGASDMTKYGFGGWTEAEMLPRLQTDIQLSLLEAFQALGDQLPAVLSDMLSGVDIRGLGAEDAASLTQRFAAVVDGVSQFMAAVEAMPFEQLKDLSFDAAAGLVQLSGGVESLVAAHEAYYQAIYTEAERLEQQRQDVERSLGKLNMTMPQTQEQYRSLVESLDLNTEAGREAYTTLISLAPAWSAVNEQMARAAQEASSAALAVSKLADGSIDMQVLATQLADATESTFVRTMVSVFDSLADRLSNIIDGIGNERGAAQAAIRQISDLGAMTPAQIMREIRGINTALPSNSGVVAAASRLNAADSLAARLKAQESALRNQYLPAQTQREAAVERFNLAQEALSEAQARVEKLEWDIYAPKTVPYKEGNWHELNAAREAAQPLIGGAREELSRAQREAQAAQAALNASPGQSTVEQLAAQYAAAVSASAKAQAQAAAAAQEAKRSQTAYADAMQGFAIDAGKSVSKLASLREETLRYYEAQAALANLMKTSAEGLRKTVLDYRVSQLNPDDQFTYLQSEFEKTYSMALSTDGEVLAGYADKLSSMLNPLIEQANNTFGSQASLDSFIATTLARAQKIAGRVEALTPTDYAADSLEVLTQIDATLAALEASTRSAEQIMVDAINAGRDATVNGLRQVVNALTGKSVAAFATGAAFTNGIVSRPTAFDIGVMGEASPEAIMPLANIGGKLGVRALGGNQDLLIEVRALRQSNEALRSEVAGLRIEARATAVSTHKIAKQGDRNEVEGVKVRTDADEPIDVRVTA